MERSDQFGTNAGPRPLWEEAVGAAGPASLLVAIDSRLGESLGALVTAEDVLQDVLLEAWSGRDGVEWRGVRSFRAWLLTLIDHRIADLRDHFDAQKRGGPGIGSKREPTHRTFAAGAAPWSSATPSRIVLHAEQAGAMRAALREVAEDHREVVRLRLFEELTAPEIGRRLGLGESAVRHRLRQGVAAYRRALAAAFSTLAGSATVATVHSASAERCESCANHPRT